MIQATSSGELATPRASAFRRSRRTQNRHFERVVAGELRRMARELSPNSLQTMSSDHKKENHMTTTIKEVAHSHREGGACNTSHLDRQTRP
jgi:hypothetical protein